MSLGINDGRMVVFMEAFDIICHFHLQLQVFWKMKEAQDDSKGPEVVSNDCYLPSLSTFAFLIVPVSVSRSACVSSKHE